MSGQKVFDVDLSWIGGTELMLLNLEEKVFSKIPELKEWHWIVAPGEINLRSDGKNIAYIHLGEFEGDLSWLQDPLIAHIIFVSYYQYQRFVERYPGIDTSKCHVLKNAIDRINFPEKDYSSKIKLVFHSEPYRGLDRLLLALSLLKDLTDIELHVFGDLNTTVVDWKIEFQDYIKKMCENDDRVILHGRKSNEEVREFLEEAHMFAYPCTWRETSCISLIEAMSAGLYCITNSFSVLPETGMGFTKIYPFLVDPEEEAKRLAEEIRHGIYLLKTEKFHAKSYTPFIDREYSWHSRIKEWQDFYNRINMV
jgi:glycosyltransferase involved in cell wall biosynthesis